MKSYTLNRIKSGRLIQERLDRVRPLVRLKVNELKNGVEYDLCTGFNSDRAHYMGEFIYLEGNTSTFLFNRSNIFDVPVGKTKTFYSTDQEMAYPRFVKSLPQKPWDKWNTYETFPSSHIRSKK